MFIFPAHVLPPATVRRFIEQQTLSGGVSLSGDEDRVLADGGGRWVVEYGGIELVDPQATRLWEAWAGYLDGGLNDCLVPLLSWGTGPRSDFGTAPKTPSRLHYDDREWPTALGYSAPEHAASIAAAALRSTVVSITTTKGPQPKGGQHFSIGTRAYRVVRPAATAGSYHIVPPLREPVDGGAAVTFDFPLLKMHADPNQELAVPLSRGRSGTVAIRFVEST